MLIIMANKEYLDEIENQIANVTLTLQEQEGDHDKQESRDDKYDKQESHAAKYDKQESHDDKDQHVNPMVEGELIKTLTKFINEIDLVFDYVNKDIVKKLEKFLNSLSNPNNMKKFVEETVPVLRDHEENISKMLNKKRARTSEFDFLNDIVLFNGLLKFNVFKDENKNTKQSLIKYLHTIYMSVFILHFGMSSGGDIDSLTQHLSGFVKGIQDRMLDEQVKNKGTSKNNKIVRQPQSSQSNNLPPVGQNFGNLMESLMQNNEIMNLATDLSRDIESQKLDPMMLLSSLMSGKPNDTVQNLVSNITNKIESKINNGEIDKSLLEQQAQSIMSSVQNSGGDIKNMFGGSLD